MSDKTTDGNKLSTDTCRGCGWPTKDAEKICGICRRQMFSDSPVKPVIKPMES